MNFGVRTARVFELIEHLPYSDFYADDTTFHTHSRNLNK